MNRQIFDPVSGKTFNMFDPDAKKSIWDPNSEFQKELEIYKLKADIQPRKVNMMQAQIGMLNDFCSEDKAKQLYVPGRGGNY